MALSVALMCPMALGLGCGGSCFANTALEARHPAADRVRRPKWRCASVSRPPPTEPGTKVARGTWSSSPAVVVSLASGEATIRAARYPSSAGEFQAWPAAWPAAGAALEVSDLPLRRNESDSSESKIGSPWPAWRWRPPGSSPGCHRNRRCRRCLPAGAGLCWACNGSRRHRRTPAGGRGGEVVAEGLAAEGLAAERRAAGRGGARAGR